MFNYLRRLAKTGVSYDHCSTQVDLNQDLSQEILDWGNVEIPEDILHNDGEDTKGREDEIHVTLLYGLLTKDPGDVQRLIPPDMSQITLRFGLITAFLDKPAYDVLKIDIESPELLRLHYILRKGLENDNSFPTYSPHCTIAYLKKGEALKFIGNDNFRYRTFTTPTMSFCQTDGHKISIPLSEHI
jgi:hypothetical protein